MSEYFAVLYRKGPEDNPERFILTVDCELGNQDLPEVGRWYTSSSHHINEINSLVNGNNKGPQDTLLEKIQDVLNGQGEAESSSQNTL